MPITVPDSPKVLTTTYENFKGVDFTNDPSNVWYRRSPDAVNMLPDEAGRPFKRTGWEIAVSSSEIAAKYAADTGNTAPSEVAIRKCYYFTLHGLDHIVIFSGLGVYFYRQKEDGTDELISSLDIGSGSNLSYDSTVMESYDRAFFFEGGGKSAFYIYGGFSVWQYLYDDGFKFEQAETYIPNVNIAVDAKHLSGEPYEDVNLFSDYVAECFQDNTYLSISGTPTITKDNVPISGATVSVDELQFTTAASTPKTYTFTYSESAHSWLLSGDQVYISNYGISVGYVGTIPDGAVITVVLQGQYRVNLGRTITDITGMKVFVSRTMQYDKELTLQAAETVQLPTHCTLVTETGGSYIKFYQSELPLVSGEDCIRVIFPRNLSTTTSPKTPSATLTATASM